MTPVRHVVLVHGAWHGAWCFSALQAELDRRGVPSLAIDLPGHGASTLPLSDMHGDAQHVVDTLATLRSRGIENVVLAGHSYGGAVISQVASIDTSVNHLVYIAAFAPEAGQSVMAQLMALPRHDTALGGAMAVGDDGNSTINPEFARDSFYGCCNDEVIAASIARLSPQPMATMTQEVTGSPRHHLINICFVFTGPSGSSRTPKDHVATLHQRCHARYRPLAICVNGQRDC